MTTEQFLGSGKSDDAMREKQVIEPAEFDGIKEQFEAMSINAHVEFIGKLTDLAPPEQFHGSVSPSARFESGEITQVEQEEAKQRIGECYVPMSKGAGVRCVEDREEEDYDDSNPASYQLGPQIQGGTIDIAVSRRLAQGVQGDETLEADVDAEIDGNTSDFTPSAHTDSNHTAEGEIGCGAQGGQEAKLGYYQDVPHMASIKGITSALYQKAGVAMPTSGLDNLPVTAQALSAIASQYYAGSPTIVAHIVEKLGGNKEARKIVQGKHHATMVMINFADGTLNPGKFNKPTNGKIMSFGLDAGYILKEYPPEEAVVLLADAVATLMNLTDGSLEVGFRSSVTTDVLEQTAA